MHVAFDGRSLCERALRGWDRYTLELLRGLVSNGIKVTLFHRATRTLVTEHLAGIDVDIIPISDKGGLSWEQVFVPKALKRFKIDLYHAPAERGVPFISPCPKVLTLHSTAQQTYRRMIKENELPGSINDYLERDPSALSLASLYWRAQVHSADHVFTPSEFARLEALSCLRLNPAKISATPLAAAAEFHAKKSAPADLAAALAGWGVKPPFILYIGGFERHKNPWGLLEAYRYIKQSKPEISLVMVGTRNVPTHLSDEGQRLSSLPGAGRVVFLSDLGRELVTLYDTADLFTSLSWMETFCLPVVEARARGLPSVVGFRGAYAEVVGDAGWYADPRDSKAAADVMIQALSERHSEKLKQAIARREAEFRWEKTVAKTIATYKTLAARR